MVIFQILKKNTLIFMMSDSNFRIYSHKKDCLSHKSQRNSDSGNSIYNILEVYIYRLPVKISML